MPKASTNHTPGRTRRRLLIVGIAALALILVGGGSYLLWDTVTENRRQARAERAVRSALDRWCSDQPIEKLRDDDAADFFDEVFSGTSTAPRPTGYQVTSVTRAKKGTYHAAVTLSFPIGPETRLYEVDVSDPEKCFIKTLAADDISETESHARSILRAWLDAWLADEDMTTFMRKHPEAAAKMTMDVTWADLHSKGKRLVRYEVTTAAPAPKGFRFTVTATVEDRGKPETVILRYTVYKDKVLSGGRWTIAGT